MKMKKSMVALTLLGASFALVACGDEDADGNPTGRDIDVHKVEVDDGRVVTCIWEGYGYKGGLSCD